MTTRRLVLLFLTGVGTLLVVAVLLALVVVGALPDEDEAAANAQAAADRVVPGQVRVLGAQWLGEAGGYVVRAVLVTDPSVSVGWHGDRRCDPGSGCESHLLTSLANGRDAAPELEAFRRALERCGLPLAGEPDVRHERQYYAGEPTTITATATVVVPRAALDTPAATRTSTALDACATAWTAERTGLTAVRRADVELALQAPDGSVHSTADVTVTGGRVTTPAASTVSPVLTSAEKDTLAAALEAPARSFLTRQGLTPSTGVSTDEIRYVPGSTSRFDVTVRAGRTDPIDPSHQQWIGVLLEANRDGTDAHPLRLVP